MTNAPPAGSETKCSQCGALAAALKERDEARADALRLADKFITATKRWSECNELRYQAKAELATALRERDEARDNALTLQRNLGVAEARVKELEEYKLYSDEVADNLEDRVKEAKTRAAELESALSEIKWVKDCGTDGSEGPGTPFRNYPEQERDLMYEIASAALAARPA